MGASAPAPRLLRLKPEDMAKVGGAPLRTGRFTWVTEAGRQERWIVASVGSYTVLWNFRWVATGAVPYYCDFSGVKQPHRGLPSGAVSSAGLRLLSSRSTESRLNEMQHNVCLALCLICTCWVLPSTSCRCAWVVFVSA